MLLNCVSNMEEVFVLFLCFGSSAPFGRLEHVHGSLFSAGGSGLKKSRHDSCNWSMRKSAAVAPWSASVQPARRPEGLCTFSPG